jgi:hypothetical protein
MSWMDPEIVLPEENTLVICQSPDSLGLIKGYRCGTDWYDVHGNPIRVTRWRDDATEASL